MVKILAWNVLGLDPSYLKSSTPNAWLSQIVQNVNALAFQLIEFYNRRSLTVWSVKKQSCKTLCIFSILYSRFCIVFDIICARSDCFNDFFVFILQDLRKLSSLEISRFYQNHIWDSSHDFEKKRRNFYAHKMRRPGVYKYMYTVNTLVISENVSRHCYWLA